MDLREKSRVMRADIEANMGRFALVQHSIDARVVAAQGGGGGDQQEQQIWPPLPPGMAPPLPPGTAPIRGINPIPHIPPFIQPVRRDRPRP
jgi:hypothetical protein